MSVGQRRAAEGAQVDVDDHVLDARRPRPRRRGAVELDRVALAVAEAEGHRGEALGPGDGQAGGGVEPAAEQHDGRADRRGPAGCQRSQHTLPQHPLGAAGSSTTARSTSKPQHRPAARRPMPATRGGRRGWGRRCGRRRSTRPAWRPTAPTGRGRPARRGTARPPALPSAPNTNGISRAWHEPATPPNAGAGPGEQVLEGAARAGAAARASSSRIGRDAEHGVGERPRSTASSVRGVGSGGGVGVVDQVAVDRRRGRAGEQLGRGRARRAQEPEQVPLVGVGADEQRHVGRRRPARTASSGGRPAATRRRPPAGRAGRGRCRSPRRCGRVVARARR